MGYRWWVVATGGLFAIGLIAGLITPPDAQLPNEYKNIVQSLAGQVEPYQISTALFIFIKNWLSILLSFVLSPLILLVPLFTILINSWFLGFISVTVASQSSPLYVAIGVLPHGIIEIPAIVIAEAAGFYFGTVLILAMFFPMRKLILGAQIRSSLKWFLLASLLMVPAAAIETYITPILIGK